MRGQVQVQGQECECEQDDQRQARDRKWKGMLHALATNLNGCEVGAKGGINCLWEWVC